MERSDNVPINSYTHLAYFYDELLGDEEAFSLWLKYIENEKFETVLELASGSGVMAAILEKKAYKVIASDLSPDMKEVAKRRFNGEYRILNMIDFNLNQKFDLILCIVDSINYLSEDELDKFFESCYRHLNDKGRLIFDMHSLKRLEEFEEEYIEEGSLSNCDYQWTILADLDDNTLNEHFTFYTEDGMYQESHCQQLFSSELILEKMQKTGFDTRIIEEFIPDEKVLVVGRKYE